MGKRFIHLPSPPDIMLLAGNCILCADLFYEISPPDIMSLAGNCILYAGTFFFSQRRSPDPRRKTRNREPPLVKSHDYFNLGTPWSALPWLLYPKAVKAKAAASSLSGGNFSRSVFIIVIKKSRRRLFGLKGFEPRIIRSSSVSLRGIEPENSSVMKSRCYLLNHPAFL